MRGIIHIGPPKTGSSSIQAFLKLNEARLREAGVYLPPTRTRVHQEFRLICLERLRKERKSAARWGIRSEADLHRLQPGLQAQAEAWLAEADTAGHDAFLISCEGFAGLAESEIERLQALMAPHCRDGFTIVAFLRRQDLQLNSMWKNKARRGGDGELSAKDKGIDYEALLNRWAAVFGESALCPAIFPDSDRQGGDLIQTFVRSAGLTLDQAAALETPGRRNAAWDRRAIAIMAAVNGHLPPLRDGAVPPERVLIENVLASAFPEPVSFRMPERQARWICAKRAEGNAAVAQRWFGRETLFHDDFSMYDGATQTEPSLDDCAHVLVRLAERAVKRQGRQGGGQGGGGKRPGGAKARRPKV